MIHRTIVVKLPLLRAVWAGQGSILRFVIWIDFFLGPWLVVCQFVEIFNQMESNGDVTSIERFFLYNATLYKFFCKMFATSPVGFIWLEMSINWHTKSQGPKTKCFYFSRVRIHSSPVDPTRNIGSFTSMAIWTVNPFFPQVYLISHSFHWYNAFFVNVGKWMVPPEKI